MIFQSEEHVSCPYCGEGISLLIDHSIPAQTYIEDCEVCCRPIDIACELNDGQLMLCVSRMDD